jgi:hypothetical protein
MQCPTCGTVFPDPPPDETCCECGKPFHWIRQNGLVFKNYQKVDGVDKPICPACLQKDQMPVAYIDRQGNPHGNG